jgi:hypothetical protein
VHVYSHKKFEGFEGGMYFDLLDRNGAEVARSNIYQNLKVCGQLAPCPDSARFEFKDGFSLDAFDAAFSIRVNQYQV